MAKTWTIEYRSIRDGEWRTLGTQCFGRTAEVAVASYFPTVLTLKREWRATPGPDLPKPKGTKLAFTIPL